MNDYELLARLRAAQLHAEAAEFRLARACLRSRRRGRWAPRFHAWLRWAVRPRVESLCDCLRQDVARTAMQNTRSAWPTSSETDAAELGSETVKDVCHLGWLRPGKGEFERRMTVLDKPNGLFGRRCMAAITLFRHLKCMPPMSNRQ